MTVTRQTVAKDSAIIERSDLQRLLDALRARGYTTIGPTLRDGAITLSEVTAIDQFPAGWIDEQDGGRYRLKQTGNPALFAYVVGPQSAKTYFHPPQITLWQAQRKGQDVTITTESGTPPRLALIGLRSCDLHAIAIQDKVFMGGPYVDPHYRARREASFIVSVQCGRAGGTCFCVSMQTGPRATSGFDLALTELVDGNHHYFVVETGSEKGAEVLQDVPHMPAGEPEMNAAVAATEAAAQQMGRTMDTHGIKELLYQNLEHPRWDQVANRCLTCANCTMVCPTCFCTTVEDTTDVTGQRAERRRKWDSCFSMDFSYIFGGHIRRTPRARYRQWLTHKLATWQDQFGTSGCVGCGRCITWCPVGIDLTEEVRAIRETQG